MGRHIILLWIEWNRINVMRKRIDGVIVLSTVLRRKKVLADSLLLSNGRRVYRLRCRLSRGLHWITGAVTIIAVIIPELLRHSLIGGRHLSVKTLPRRLLCGRKLFGISGALWRSLTKLLRILKSRSRQRIA